MRFQIEKSSPTEADILVEGRVTLHFRNIEGRVVKVAATSRDRKPAVISRKDFADARALAMITMEDLRLAVEESEGFSNEDIARQILTRVRRSMKPTSFVAELDAYLESAKTWCSPARRARILVEAGKMGAAASARKAAARRKKARQGELPL